MAKQNTAGLVLLSCVLALGMFSLMHKRGQRFEIETGLASINKSGVIVYSGPNKRSGKLWRLNHKNWPIMVLEVSKSWAKITDFYNTTGWIEKRNIGKPYALVTQEAFAIADYKDENSNVLAQLFANASVEFIQQVNGKYCKISLGAGKKAFVECGKLLYRL